MPNDKAIGKGIYKDSIKWKRNGDKVLDKIERELGILNRTTTNAARRLYNSVIKRLVTDQEGMIVNSVSNLSQAQFLTTGLDPITSRYREVYGEMFRKHREELFDNMVEREARIAKRLEIIGEKENRAELTEESWGIISVINEQNLRKVNNMLLKWKETVYDIFVAGVVKSLDPVQLLESFFTTTGSLKIGSSLEEESVAAAMYSATEQRNSFNRQRAKELNYDYCWNANPMDQRTKSECISATIAGVIPEKEMGTIYGFPPRHICRCELIYTRGEWTGVNEAINSEIRGQRTSLLEELYSAPTQVASWIWKGKRIMAPAARAGQPYAEVQEKIDLLESMEVPEYFK
jgi:hypothetical protein